MQTLVPSGVNSLLLRRQTVCITALISPLTLLWIISKAWPKVYWPIINCKKIMSPISDWIVWLYLYSSCSDISLWSRAPCMISINHCITMIQDIISIEPNDILNKLNLSGVVDYLFFYCKKLVSFRLSFQKIWPWPILHIGQLKLQLHDEHDKGSSFSPSSETSPKGYYWKFVIHTLHHCRKSCLVIETKQRHTQMRMLWR